jgi:hypothetical protein
VAASPDAQDRGGDGGPVNGGADRQARPRAGEYRQRRVEREHPDTRDGEALDVRVAPCIDSGDRDRREREREVGIASLDHRGPGLAKSRRRVAHSVNSGLDAGGLGSDEIDHAAAVHPLHHVGAGTDPGDNLAIPAVQ